jgi:hypothetical protein
MEDEMFMKARDFDKSFYYQTDKGHAEFYRNLEGYSFTLSVVAILTIGDYCKEKYPLFVDMITAEDYPLNIFGPVIIFNTFRDRKYKEIAK